MRHKISAKRGVGRLLEGGRLIEGGGGGGEALVEFFFIIVGVTGSRRLENGQVVPGKFTASTKSAAIGQNCVKERDNLWGQAHGDGNNHK